jgi:hypothetical protein
MVRIQGDQMRTVLSPSGLARTERLGAATMKRTGGDGAQRGKRHPRRDAILQYDAKVADSGKPLPKVHSTAAANG